jgi:hypothetical protein
VINTIRVEDFTGGLNLDANIFQLKKNQTNDLLNVDINPRGGVAQRYGIERMNTTAVGSLAAGNFYATRLHPWQGATRQLMLSANNKVFYATNDNFTSVKISGVDIATDNAYGASFSSWNTGANPVLYIARGEGYPVSKWNGSTCTNLTVSATGAWQEDLTNPNGTHAPKGQFVATHVDRLWVANTTENGASFPNRVRFSHPLFPESFRSSDFIDLPAGGDRIVSIVPYGGHLLVFKKRAVFAIYGYSEDTFQVVELSRSLGAVNANAVALTDLGVFFFSHPDGVFLYDGRGFKNIFTNLRRLIVDNEITETSLDAVSMGYANRRLVLSVPSGDEVSATSITYDSSATAYDYDLLKYDGQSRSTRATVSYVFDPVVGSDGAWTAYKTSDNYGLIGATDYIDNNGNKHHVAAHPFQPYVLKFDVYGLHQDNIVGTAVAFDSYYLTPWMDGGNVSAKKFWRRPDLIMLQQPDGTSVDVTVYHDWDQLHEVKSFTISQDAIDSSGTTWSSWNEPDWGSTFSRADSLGLARAVQLKFAGNGTDPWSMNSISYKYNPRKIKV